MKLGRNQLYILSMMNPEYPIRKIECRTEAILRSLERRGLVYKNWLIWRLTKTGVAVKKSTP